MEGEEAIALVTNRRENSLNEDAHSKFFEQIASFISYGVVPIGHTRASISREAVPYRVSDLCPHFYNLNQKIF